MTAAETLVKGWIVSPVQLIDGKFPDGMGPGWTLTGVAVTLVRHPEVERVGPDGDTAQGSGDAGVIHEALVSHPAHQSGRFLKTRGHRLETGAVGGQTGILPGEITHGCWDQLG